MVRFVYHAEPRTVHPHVVFVSQDGHVLLNGTEPPRKGWRAYHLDEISGLEPLGHRFKPDRGYRPHSPNYHQIICAIDL